MSLKTIYKSLLPLPRKEAGIMEKFLNALGAMLNTLSDRADNIVLDLYVNTMTDRIEDYELLFGLPVNPSDLTEAQRRSLIKSRRSARGLSVQAFKDLVKSFTGVEPEIIEYWQVLGETWDSIDTTWATETRAWDEMGNLTDDDRFTWEVVVDNNLVSQSYNETDLTDTLQALKPVHTTLIVTINN